MDFKTGSLSPVNDAYPKKILCELVSLPSEKEFLEFKSNYCSSQEIGEYISALSNSACLNNKSHGYLIFGIEKDGGAEEVILMNKNNQ